MATQLEERPVDSGVRTAPGSKGLLWAGRVVSWLPALFLLFDGAMKLAKPQFVVDGTAKYGYPEGSIVPLGIVLLASTALYLIPRTSILGAVLLTGYLGGAVATHASHPDDGLFAVFFPVIFGALLWLGLVLRDARLRAMFPLRTSPGTRP